MPLFPTGHKLNSIFGNRCPRCHKGKFWPTGPFRNLLLHGGGIYHSCSHCGLKYEREKGYWYGSMYVSYGVGIAIMVAAWVATSVLWPEMEATPQVLIIIGAILFLAPINFWLSRLVWINLFVSYSGEREKPEAINPKPEIVKV